VKPFASPPRYANAATFTASAGQHGVLVTGVDGRFRYLPWANPDRVRKIKQRLGGDPMGTWYNCPTVTAHAAYCVMNVGSVQTPRVGSETVFLDGRTPAVNIRMFAREHGLELRLPTHPDDPQLATSTSELVSMVNVHGRIISIPFGKGKVKKSDGKIAGVSQVIRGLGGVLIVGEDGVYRLNKPTGKPHLLVSQDSLGSSA
jgi:hypothetical protein